MTNDASLTDGIRRHLIYLRRTPSKYLRGEYASAHTENPKSPYYSKTGERAGASSDLAFGSGSDRGAIDAWLAAPFHAIGMLRPSLTAVAFYRDPGSGYAGLNVITHTSGSGTATVLYPHRRLDLARFGGESPDPIQTCRRQHPRVNWDSPGFPIVAMPEGLQSSAGVSATLTSPDGRRITSATSLCVVSASTYYSTDTVYGPTGRAILDGDGAILLVAPKPFTNGRYLVHLDLGADNGGRILDWSFQTKIPLPAPRVRADAVRCSFPAFNSGGFDFRIVNNTDRTTTYTATVDASRRVVRVAGGDSTRRLRIRTLHQGRKVLRVRGGDGTSRSVRVSVPRCSVARSARASLRTRAHSRRVKVTLDNRRNLARVRYVIRVGSSRTKAVAVLGRHRRTATVTVPKHSRTTITVSVGRHVVVRRALTR